MWIGSQYSEAHTSLNQTPEGWLLENSMKLETRVEDKAEIRFMPPAAAAFQLFQVEEAELTAAGLFLGLGI